MMKHLKLFETFSNRKKQIINTIKNITLGSNVDESTIYQYVEQMHDGYDFEEGNLDVRIEHYPYYILEIVLIDNITNLDEFQLDEDKMDEFISQYEETNYYPPIVLDHTYKIIDGTHRANTLYNIGQTKILAFVGKGNDVEFDPFSD